MSISMEQFWRELQQAGVVSGTIPVAGRSGSPWYIRVLLGISGWIAALFLFGFAAVGFEVLLDNGAASLTAGGLCLAAAYLIFKKVPNDFAGQFGLALSLAGQILVLISFDELLSWQDSGPWLIMAGMQAVIAVVMPHFIQRCISGYLAGCTLAVALSGYGAYSLVPPLIAFLAALSWLKEFHWRRLGTMLRPVTYGLTLSLLQLEGQRFFMNEIDLVIRKHGQIVPLLPEWCSDLLMAALLVAVVAWLLVYRGRLWTGKNVATTLLLTAAVAAVSLKVPGIAAGMMILLLGFANSNRILLALGIVAQLFYISAYYYFLQETLLTKAEILAATGVVVLLARWVVLKWIFPHGEDAHA